MRNALFALDTGIKLTIKTNLGTNLLFQLYLGVCLFHTMMLAFLNLQTKQRIIVVMINSLLYVAIGIFYTAGMPSHLPQTLAMARSEPFWVVYLFIVSNAFQHLFQQLIKSQYQSKLYAQFLQYKLQTEQHLILHNLDSGIITFTDDSLKYFNQEGKSIIDAAVSNLEEPATKAKASKEVSRLTRAIAQQKQLETGDNEEGQIHLMILNNPVFRQYVRDESHNPSDAAEFSLNQLLSVGKATLKTLVLEFIHQNGDKRYFQVTVSKLESFDSKFYVLKISDFTVKVQFDLSIGEKRLLELVNAFVSHEMRNPINAILGMTLHLKSLVATLFLSISRKGIADSDLIALKKEMEDAIGVQESSTKLLNFFVSDLLCLAQIEKGTLRKNIHRFCVKEAVEEVMLIQHQKAESKRITIAHKFVGFHGDFSVVTDKNRLQQVLLSYQSNALKFTPIGGRIDITATKVSRGGDQLVEIEVQDNGTGISDQDQLKLFKLFGYLKETETLNSQGVGLGLYITKMIVTAFGGQVGIRSAIGRGSTFQLSFKLSALNDESQTDEREFNPIRFWEGVKIKVPNPQASSLNPMVHARFSQPIQPVGGNCTDRHATSEFNIETLSEESDDYQET